VKLLDGGSTSLFFVGSAGAQYVLERSYTLVPADWVPMSTNSADAQGFLALTNTSDYGTNVFWRMRSVP
jgi:hypothetical protein